MHPLPAIRWPSTPNDGFDRFATPGFDPQETIVFSVLQRLASEYFRRWRLVGSFHEALHKRWERLILAASQFP
jgi:hypothetical protein